MVKEELLKALANYKGPITKLRDGKAESADDIRRWALNRTSGGSGVPDEEQWRKRKRYFKKLRHKHRKKIKRYRKQRQNSRPFEDGDTTGPPPWED